MPPMSQPLAGRRALVMGGSSGLGLATARLLAQDGATVTIAGRDEARLQAAVEQLGTDGLRVTPQCCDAMNADDVRAAVAAASGDPPLAIAVCVPGGGLYVRVTEYGEEILHRACRPVPVAVPARPRRGSWWWWRPMTRH